ncbi:unnamed protein product [Blepharisma stoltei]|uniref:Kinetochore protein Spc24 n=1 Tax=Blepharisma stoltei TaxID=1481888 RepID=A0AAU9K3M4_9CILI|nr:unnamed protein product [Blepharisma stoltei]
MDADLERSLKACDEVIRDLPNTIQEYLDKLNEDTAQIDQFLTINKQQDSQKLKHLQLALEQKEAERKQMEEKIQALEYEYNNTQAEINAAYLRNEAQKEKIQSYDKQHAEELQKILEGELEKIDHMTKEISLYCNITQLRWDFDKEDTISGRILKNNESVEFSIKPSPGEDLINFRTVNELWKVLD